MGYGSGCVFVESISYVGMQRSERRRNGDGTETQRLYGKPEGKRKGSKRVLHPEDTQREKLRRV